MKKYFFILALAAGLASCNNSKKSEAAKETEMNSETGTASATTDLSGKDWKLVALDGQTLSLDPNSATPHVKFDNAEQISGNLGCNSFGGNYKTEGSQISFSKIVATQMACPNLATEQSFLQLLNTAKTFNISQDTLVLTNGTSEAKLVLQ